YGLPEAGLVTIRVYDVLGNEVAILVNERMEEGRYEVTLDASSLSSGVYIYHMRVNDFIDTKKMILMK
ncbi:MAG: T9SS type A sorting domain-containing protein, partial [Ignavibacteriaceae bacterium]